MVDPWGTKGNQFDRYTDEELAWFRKTFPRHAELPAALAEIESRKNKPIDSPEQFFRNMTDDVLDKWLASRVSDHQYLHIAEDEKDRREKSKDRQIDDKRHQETRADNLRMIWLIALGIVVILGIAECLSNRRAPDPESNNHDTRPSTSPLSQTAPLPPAPTPIPTATPAPSARPLQTPLKLPPPAP